MVKPITKAEREAYLAADAEDAAHNAVYVPQWIKKYEAALTSSQEREKKLREALGVAEKWLVRAKHRIDTEASYKRQNKIDVSALYELSIGISDGISTVRRARTVIEESK